MKVSPTSRPTDVQDQPTEEEVSNKLAGDPYAEACATQPCRPGAMHALKVETNDVSTFIQPVPRSPYVKTKPDGEQYLQIFPGETVTVTGDTIDGRLVNLHPVTDDRSSQSITFRFFQGHPDTGAGVDTFLVATSTYPEVLRYRAFMEMPPETMAELTKIGRAHV